MIDLKIKIVDDKSYIDYADDKIKLGDVSLMIYELEKIKLFLMDKEFDQLFDYSEGLNDE